MLKKKLGWVAVCLSLSAWAKIPTGEFSSVEIQPVAGMIFTQLAVIDDSPQSLAWVKRYEQYLKHSEIPVMVIGADEASFTQIKQHLSVMGILVGKAPEPEQLMEDVLKQIGIPALPVMIEGGTAWQVQIKEQEQITPLTQSALPSESASVMH